jgi:hypothetical protein
MKKDWYLTCKTTLNCTETKPSCLQLFFNPISVTLKHFHKSILVFGVYCGYHRDGKTWKCFYRVLHTTNKGDPCVFLNHKKNSF